MRSCLYMMWMLPVAVVLSGCSGEQAKKTTADAAKKTVEVTKGAITGIDEGIEQGRKAAESADGAIILSTKEEFAKALTVEVLTVRKALVSPLSVGTGWEDGATENVAGFANDGEKPVRVTEFDSKGTVILLDTEGYVVKAGVIPREFTVPEKAKYKVTFRFPCKPEAAGKLRIHGVDFPCPQPAAAD